MASDNFNRADANPLDGNWTTVSGIAALKIVSNAVLGTSTNTSCGARHNVSTVADSQVTVSAKPSGNVDSGPALFQTGAFNGYTFSNYTGSDLFIFRVDGGSFNNIATVAGVTVVAGDVLRLRRSGANVIGSRNGVDVLTVSDSTYTNVVPAIFCYDGVCSVDDWTDGASAAASSLLLPYRPPMGALLQL